MGPPRGGSENRSPPWVLKDSGPGGVTGRTTVGLTGAAKQPSNFFLSLNSEGVGPRDPLPPPPPPPEFSTDGWGVVRAPFKGGSRWGWVGGSRPLPPPGWC